MISWMEHAACMCTQMRMHVQAAGPRTPLVDELLDGACGMHVYADGQHVPAAGPRTPLVDDLLDGAPVA
jgi:hypothetical protein